MVMKWEMGTHDNDYAQGILTVDGKALAEVYVNYQTIGWSATRATWEFCRMPAGGHNDFSDMWSAMQTAEASVREAIGAFYRMGMGLDGNDRRVLLAGASNMGLADPGHGTAMSLMQVTAAFVESKPTLDSLIELKVLQLLEDETGEAFLRAHQAAERIAREKRFRQPRGYRDGD